MIGDEGRQGGHQDFHYDFDDVFLFVVQSEIYEQTMLEFWQKMQLLGLKCPENVLIKNPTGNALQ